MEKKLKRCFGKEYRSPRLGSRHIDKGIYYDQLLRWFEEFDPSSFFITSLESVNKEPDAVMAAILDFIGANKDKDGNEVEIVPQQVDFKALSSPNHLAHSQPLPAAFKERLEAFFQPYMVKLHALLAAKYGTSQRPKIIM